MKALSPCLSLSLSLSPCPSMTPECCSGNVIDPLDSIQEYGCDALRMALLSGTTPGQDISLSAEKLEANR